MLLICYSNCSTCKGIERMMEEKQIAFDRRDIKSERPTAQELKHWHEQSGLDIGKFYNTSGMLYREGNIREKRKTLDLKAQYELLASDGMLVKRPILLTDDGILVGAQVKRYIESL